MLSSRLAFAALAVACIGAAAGGGYLASRQNVMPVAASAVSAPVPAASSLSSAATPVQETEAVVGDTTPAAPRPTPPAAAVKHADLPARATAQATARAPQPAPAKRAEPLPTLERSWPSGSTTTAPSGQSAGTPSATTATASADASAPAPRSEDRVAQQESPRAPEPPQKTFQELVVSADSVIGLQEETSLSSETAKVEDRVEARVTREVRVHDTIAIPAGTRALGSVVQVDRGGKFKQTARLGIRFNTLVLADGTRLPITTETIFRDGDAPSRESASKIGGAAVGGAILGAILGGGKGAAIGAAAGAGAGTGIVMAGDRSSATFSRGEPITVRITSPVTVTIEK
jgi:hypothetical protein